MILGLGDIHGNFANVKYQIQTKGISHCKIIQVGDFGMTMYSQKHSESTLQELDSYFRELDIIMYAIRGNHDDPFYFQGNHIYDNLKLLPDYTQLEIDGLNFLFIGGATSIDRNHSLAKMEISSSLGYPHPIYWIDEVFNLDEEKLKDIKDVDIVITHTAPEWCFPDAAGGLGDFVKNFVDGDDALTKELVQERKKMNRLFNILKENGNRIQKHFYGHFHRNEITLNGYTMHVLLGIGELREIVDRVDDDYEKIFNQ